MRKLVLGLVAAAGLAVVPGRADAGGFSVHVNVGSPYRGYHGGGYYAPRYYAPVYAPYVSYRPYVPRYVEYAPVYYSSSYRRPYYYRDSYYGDRRNHRD